MGGFNLPASDQNPKGYRKVEPARIFREIGRCKVDRYPSLGEIKSRIGNRRTHPISGLAHGSIRQTNDREVWQTVGKIRLNLDRKCTKTSDCPGVNN